MLIKDLVDVINKKLTLLKNEDPNVSLYFWLTPMDDRVNGLQKYNVTTIVRGKDEVGYTESDFCWNRKAAKTNTLLKTLPRLTVSKMEYFQGRMFNLDEFLTFCKGFA